MSINPKFRRSVAICVALSLLALVIVVGVKFSAVSASAGALGRLVLGPAKRAGAAPSLSKMLKPDGSLDLTRGFQGSLDPHGYQMKFGHGGAPRFMPAATSAALFAPGDELWDTQFVNGIGAPGFVDAVTVSGTNIYIGGFFSSINGTPANSIAMWNGTTWSALGSGVGGAVYSIVVSGANVYVGGVISSAGGAAAGNVAMWNGTTWSNLAGGANGVVNALRQVGTDIYAGGFFSNAGGVGASNIAKWTGAAWAPLGVGCDDVVYALTLSGTNLLYVGGGFANAGGAAAGKVAIWNTMTSTWSTFGGVGINSLGAVFALAFVGTDLYVGGLFTMAGAVPVSNIAKWDGTVWTPLGAGTNSTVLALSVSGADLYAAGFFSAAGGAGAGRVARWNGSAWFPLGSGVDGTLNCVAATVANVYVGGFYTLAGSVMTNNFAVWNGTDWATVGTNGMVKAPNAGVFALAQSGSDTYIGGGFTSPGNYITRWNGTTFNSLSTGMDGSVGALTVSGTDLYAGGIFFNAGGTPALRIAKWDGSAWSALGAGINGNVNAIAVIGSNIYAGGFFTMAGSTTVSNIAVWNGTTWAAIGAGVNGEVKALAVIGTDLYVGGLFTMAGGNPASRIAKLSAGVWSAIGAGLNGDVNALAVGGTDLYIGGSFSTAGPGPASNVAKLTGGTTYSALGTGTTSNVNALAFIGSDLYAGGAFLNAGSNPASFIAKWNGTAWSNLGSGTNRDVNALTGNPTSLFVGGDFVAAGLNPSHYFGRYTNCPVIATQPTSQAVCTGSPATFSVTAGGVAPFTYQWRKNGTNIVGATMSAYTIPTTVAGDAGNYDVLVTSSCGSATSLTVTLTVSSGTTITTQPAAQAVCAGAAASFTVVATGAGLTYQWRKGGAPIGGATMSTYTIPATVAGDAGSYDVVVTGTCGAPVTSTAATLTVGSGSTITTQPASQMVCAGAPASFTVVATGAGLTYQWRKGGVNIPTATAATYMIPATIAADAGSYDVVITTGCGPITSNAATLTINPVTTIATQPAAQTVCAGASASFSVVAGGTGPFTYQWRKGGAPIGGATASTYSIAATVVGDAGSYDVVVTGACGTATSSAAALTVTTGTTITTQPASQSVCLGASASFSVVATGSGLTYQWRKGGVNIPTATASTYTIAATIAGDAGSYDVVVTGACGTATSSAAALTVTTGTTITTQPASQTVCVGASAGFSVVAGGTGPFTYQWRKNGTNIGGATASTFSIAATVAGDAANYSVVVTGACGSTTSANAALTVNAATTIMTQPVAQTVCAGAGASFSVVAGGTGPFTYQWRKNGTDIGGAIASTFTIGSTVAADAANYSVVVTGACGSATSNNAALTVNPVTTITTQPASQTVCTGASANFSVVAGGTGPFTYQWRKNGTDIGGATASTFSIGSTVAADAANYSVVVTGACGSATSNNAALTVNAVTTITTQPVAQTVCAGSSANFSVVATGTGLTYQWRKGGVNISGATASTFTIPSTIAGDAGAYDVIVTGTCGTVTSAAATLTVNPATAITTQPVGLTGIVGQGASFTVAANGVGLSYQWRKNGANIGGATVAAYSIPSVIPTDAGSYDVVVTGTCGTVTSSAAILTVNCQSITVNPTTIPTGFSGIAYNQTFTQTGGNGAITFSLNGALPTGMNFNAGAATLGGIPAAQGNFSITIRATDVNGCFGERNYTLSIGNCPVILITPTAIPSGTTGTPYSQVFNQTGAFGTPTFNLTGTLPTGLSFNAGTRTLSGTPTQAGAFPITVSAQDSNGCTGTRNYTLQICPVITVTPATISGGTIGNPYNQTLTQTGGVGTVSWSVTAGSLPNNLTLNSVTGAITGTSVMSGTFNFTARATDVNGCFGERAYTLTIGSCPTITLSPLTVANGTIGVAYNQTIQASGGTPTYTYSLSVGSLPTGLTLNASAGVISGIPTVQGTFSFTVKATDINGCMGTRDYTLKICQGITINPASIPNSTTFTFYTQTFTQIGISGSPTWGIASGAAPTGLTLDASTGVLSGAPTATGIFTFTIRATDAGGCFGERVYSVTITPNSGLMYYPLSKPIRLLDTRTGATGCTTPGVPLPGGTAITQQARVTCDGVTIPSTALAVVGNATVVNFISGPGFVTLYPTGAQQPTVSNLNYLSNQIIPNAFTVGLNASGQFNIFATTSTQFIVDITGYYAPPGASGLYYHPLPNPIRLLDTRNGATGCATPGAPLTGGQSRTQNAELTCNGVTIPANAEAIVGNGTVVNFQSPGGFITLYPDGAQQPTVSNLNYVANQIIPNAFTVGLGPSGAFKIFASATTDFIVDLTGYYSSEAGPDVNGVKGLLYNPLSKPIRLLDTRQGATGCDTPGAPLTGGATRAELARVTCDGITIPASAQAVVGNGTVVNFLSGGGFITLWPTGATQPTVSNLNYLSNQIIPNAFTVGLGANGEFNIFATTTTHFIADLTGYFAP